MGCRVLGAGTGGTVQKGCEAVNSRMGSSGGLRMSDLLPCPFCGNERVAMLVIRDGRRGHCFHCHAEGPPRYHSPKGQPSAEERAIDAWNNRTPAAISQDAKTTERR